MVKGKGKGTGGTPKDEGKGKAKVANDGGKGEGKGDICCVCIRSLRLWSSAAFDSLVILGPARKYTSRYLRNAEPLT